MGSEERQLPTHTIPSDKDRAPTLPFQGLVPSQRHAGCRRVSSPVCAQLRIKSHLSRKVSFKASLERKEEGESSINTWTSKVEEAGGQYID